MGSGKMFLRLGLCTVFLISLVYGLSASTKGGTAEMKYTRIYTGPDGESHFEDVEVSMEDVYGGLARVSEPMKADGIGFLEVLVNDEPVWHNAPYRRFAIVLEGWAELEVGDGTRRRFGPGDVVLAEDTTGRGHITRILNNQPQKMVTVALD